MGLRLPSQHGRRIFARVTILGLVMYAMPCSRGRVEARHSRGRVRYSVSRMKGCSGKVVMEGYSSSLLKFKMFVD